MAAITIRRIPKGLRCQSADCPEPAMVEAFDDIGMSRGVYCGSHGQAWLREQRERAREAHRRR